MNILHRLQKDDVELDLSLTLREPSSWKPGNIASLPPPSDVVSSISSMAIEAALGILAIGTSSGKLLLYGAPPATAVLDVPQGVGRHAKGQQKARFTAFCPSLKGLICIDDSDALHIWNLDPQNELPTPPVLLKSFPFPGPVTTLATSPAHSHIFVGLASGDVMTYDVERLCPSPYVVPNLWIEHEDVLRRTGLAPDEIRSPSTTAVIEVLVHPRDLNLLFVAYEGGVILYNISSEMTVHTYQLTLHPGAAGGGNYNQEEIFTERHPLVTAISVHPSGHMLAIGHLDGCISFWATEDDDRPLAVRTLSDPWSFMDVHIPDPMALADDAPEGDAATAKRPKAPREPIFKLAWTGKPDPETDSQDYGAFAPTALTVLGGTLPTDSPGLIVLNFPALILPQPEVASNSVLSPQTPHLMPPSTRQALKASLFPSDTLEVEPTNLIPTDAPVDDFLLIPKDNSYLNGLFDPIGIILLTSAEGRRTSILSTLAFPPRGPPSQKGGSDRLRLPVELDLSYLQPDEFMVGAQVLKFEHKEVFGRLINAWINVGDTEKTSFGPRVSTLRGGSAWSDFSHEDGPDPKLYKYDHNRVMITRHRDLTIRFYDISSQLLLSASALHSEWPQILPHLTLDVGQVIPDLKPKRRIYTNPAAPTPTPIEITSVHLARSSLECAAVLSTGDVIVWKFKDSGCSPPPCNIEPEDASVLVYLDEHAGEPRTFATFHPFCRISRADSTGIVAACALSDVGFIAVAHGDNSLLVVDLRGPRVLLHETWVPKEGDKDKKGPVLALNWTICGVGSRAQHQLRLLASHQNGSTQIYSFRKGQRWELDSPDSGHSSRRQSKSPTTALAHASPADPLLSVVLEGRRGTEMTATPEALQKALAMNAETEEGSTSKPKAKDVGVHCFWLVAGKQEAKCFENVTGDKAGSVDWSKGGEIVHLRVVERIGYQALVAFHADFKASVYSLPELELIHTLDLPHTERETNPAINCDIHGEYVAFTAPQRAKDIPSLTYNSLFHFRRIYPSMVDFGEPQPTIAVSDIPQPRPVPLTPNAPAGLASWIWNTGPKVWRGSEIDAILAGPDRPPPIVRVKPKPAPETPGPRPNSPPAASESSFRRQSSTAADIKRSSSQRGDVFSRLRSLASERGDKVNQLEEAFASLENSSKGMAGEAKKLAVQQTAKRWLPKFR